MLIIKSLYYFTMIEFPSRIGWLLMIRYVLKLTFLICVLSIVYTLAGCADFESKSKDEYFLRVGDRVITVLDFNRAFEIAKAAYPHNAIQQPAVAREARLDLVNQMIEEMILQERAKELDIKITDAEVEKAVADIKLDYPDDVFDQVLLENAVPYNSWEEGIKKHLLIEKVVAKELDDQIEITPDDVSKYYEERYKNDMLKSDIKDVPKEINETIIKILRREKMEEAYKFWIMKLQRKYTIKINETQLEKITGS